jgi:hypothetical protein
MLNLLAFLVLAAASPWGAPVTPQGVGPFRVGMSIAALHRIGAVQDRLPPALEEDDVCCGYWRLPGHPGLVAMMTFGLVVRIDIDGPLYRTRSGVHVGMAEAEVRARLGAGMRVAPAAQGTAGRLLTLRARGSPYGLLVETDGSRATRMRVGQWQHLVDWGRSPG